MYDNIKHTTYECKYHIVFIPKYRRKSLYSALRRNLGDIFHDLARQKESKIIKGHICLDHVHMLISIPPKFAISNVIGFIKGKSAITIARNFRGRNCCFSAS